jgi:Zn-finger nucleic acid-binding protein
MSDAPYRAAVPPQHVEKCLFCAGAVDVTTSACTACGANAASAEHAHPTRGCPRCDVPLETLGLEGQPVWRCPTCHGAFIPQRAWGAIVDAVRDKRVIDLIAFVPPVPDKVPTAGTLALAVHCVACGLPAERATFGALSQTTVDVCAKHGLWLDSAELGAVVEFARRVWAAGGQLPMSEEDRRKHGALQIYLLERAKGERRELDAEEARERERERLAGYNV